MGIIIWPKKSPFSNFKILFQFFCRYCIYNMVNNMSLINPDIYRGSSQNRTFHVTAVTFCRQMLVVRDDNVPFVSPLFKSIESFPVPILFHLFLFDSTNFTLYILDHGYVHPLSNTRFVPLFDKSTLLFGFWYRRTNSS